MRGGIGGLLHIPKDSLQHDAGKPQLAPIIVTKVTNGGAFNELTSSQDGGCLIEGNFDGSSLG